MDPTPEQRLAGAVFQQALTDACKGRGALRRQAEGWLLHGDGEVAFWCHLAGLNVAKVRVGVQRALEQRVREEIQVATSCNLPKRVTGKDGEGHAA